MKKILFYSLCILIARTGFGQSNVFEEKVTSASNIATTVTNLGLIGNSFRGSFNVLDYPSFEFPVNSGIEHVFDGGLWVGGIVNGEISVSTGAVDDPSGYSTGKGGFEFTSTEPLRERSSLFDSPFFDPEAISHQDFVSTFSDTALFINTGTGKIPIQNHLKPLGIKIDFQAYNWNFSFADFFVILNFKITNVNSVPIDSIHVGYWMDGVVRNINITPPGGSAFFNKGGNGYVDSLDMGYEFDAIGDIGFTDSYIATKYLGAEINGSCPALPQFQAKFNTWQFRNSTDPLLFFPTSDLQRFDKLSNGLNQRPDWETIKQNINSANNRSNLISAGPFETLNPGESIDVAFALVCAKRVKDGLPATANTAEQRANLLQNAGWAQTAYLGEDANGNCIIDPGEDRDNTGTITRFILPSPPDVPKTRVIPGDHTIDVYWSDNSEKSVDPISKEMDFEGFKLYKTSVGFDVQNTQNLTASLNLVSSWDIPGDGLFFDNGFEKVRLDAPVTFEGDTVEYWYRYTFENVANGWQHVIALTAFDQGDEVNNLTSLESAPLANLIRVFAGKPDNKSFSSGDPFVYPNPYYAGAAWEGASTFEEDRKLIFANLPSRCEVRIYTLSGDLVDVFEHNGPVYNGADIKWFDTYSDPTRTRMPEGEHAWDLLSQDNQIMSRGLYLFVVTDLDTGERKRGKFVLIK